MKNVKVIILRAAGTNCDIETRYAFQLAGAEVTLVHINELVKEKTVLTRCHILAIPGGFTYGDDIASGKVFANELRFKLSRQLGQFVKDGKLIIGICNGFQVLVKMGLLPNPNFAGKIEATLGLNDSCKFEDRWVYLKKTENKKSEIKNDLCVWTKDLPDIIYLPIAHGEGKFMTGSDKVLKSLHENRQIVFRYTDKQGRRSAYPYNPNGSEDDIAGICNPTGTILGMMPHPERNITKLQHPNWRRFDTMQEEFGTGLAIFKNGVKFARNSL